jgi:hypothetical protein
MKIFSYRKDGGPYSTVSGLFFIEIKSLFSIVLLHFDPGSRDAYHNHAFNAVSWVLRGKLDEHILNGKTNNYKPSLKPISTSRSTFHKVVSDGHTWVLTFRGPWLSLWNEFLPDENKLVTLTYGRKVVNP